MRFFSQFFIVKMKYELVFLLCFTLLETIYGYPQRTLFDLSTDPCPNEKKMPNIGYIFMGYDVYKGNPLPTGNEVIDHGFKFQIFEANYDEGKLTPDGRYCVPEATQITGGGGCSLIFGEETYTGTQKYTDKCHAFVGFSVDLPGGSFGASIDFKHIQEDTQTYENIFTHSDATCITYVVKNLPYTHAPFSKSFQYGLQSLPEEYGDGEAYFEFIGYFGTHYIIAADMGALFGRQLKISKSSWSHMQQDSIDIGFNVKIDAMEKANATLNATIGFNHTQYEEFKRNVQEERTYSRGAPPPEDFKATTWMAATKENPAPMRLDLKPLTNLLFDEVTPQVKDNLKQALEEYCPWLLKTGVLTSCSPPPPDPPLPQFRAWSWWATPQHRFEHEYPPKQCEQGQFISKMSWRYVNENGLFGITDVAVQCFGNPKWFAFTNSDWGDWTHAMECTEGFKQVTAKEYRWDVGGVTTDLTNVKALCYNGFQDIYATDDFKGDWRNDLMCIQGKMVGIQVQQSHGKLTNFKIQCEY